MKIGLAGYSGSGVTTFLSLISEDPDLVEKHTGPEVRSVKLPDPRLERLAEMFGSKKTTPIHMDLVELGDLRPEKSGGLRTQTLKRTAGLDALVVVLRGFDAPMSPGCRPADELVEDLTALIVEFCLTDLIPVEGRLERLSKEGKITSTEAALLEKVKAQLEEGRPTRAMELSKEEVKSLSGYQFLTQFPLMVVVNVGEECAASNPYSEFREKCVSEGIAYMNICAKVELELLELPEDERAPFLEELGLKSLSRGRFVLKIFDLLRLVTFFTVNEREARGWVVSEGTRAIKAAGKVHDDMERGFIRAEVLSCEECFELGGFAQAREAGKLNVEGKDYLVREGDVIQVRFNI
ncbi:redox-regulated ATPase YchF [bacterium]|nr:MAG: redox-regulated ATPase YchF [bacterium]